MNPQGRGAFISVLLGLGLLLVYAGERLVGQGSARAVLSGAGVVAVLVAVTLRVVRLTRAEGARREVERLLLGLSALAGIALLVYFLSSDLGLKAADAAPGKGTAKLVGVLSVLWPALLAAALVPLALCELAYSGMVRAKVVEAGRVRDALLSGLGLVGALVFAFSAVYVATERDVKWDLSYFRTAKPGEATRALVRGLDAPLQVSLFFPPANEVSEQLKDYFDVLERESPQLQVARYDQAIDVAKARELQVSGNGAVVFSRGGRKEQLLVGTELERARTQLRSLDQEVNKRLSLLARAKRVVYLTSGHGERSQVREATDQNPGTTKLRRALGAQNYELKDLGVAEGLATEVPSDAAAVLVLGPTQPFLPEEATALERYLAKGGRVLFALDPEAKADFNPFLAKVGLAYDPTILANDAIYYAKTRQPSDRAIIATASYSSHPSVSTLARLGNSGAMVFVVAGSLEERRERPLPATVDFTIHAERRTFRDLDGNFTFDPAKEARKPYELAAAVTLRQPSGKKEDEGRMVVLADVDAVADFAIDNLGNAQFAVDAMKWVLGEEQLTGAVSSEEDVPVEHTRKQDVAWFYSTVIGAPLLVLAAGYLASRRRGRKARPVSAPEVTR